MLSFLKKKARESENATIESEDELVQQIVELYTTQDEAEKNMFNCIERQAKQAKTEWEKRELLQLLEELKKPSYYDTMFDRLKLQLFSTDSGGCTLSHLELSACFLICTKKYLPDVVTDMLCINKPQLLQVLQFFEDKMAKCGHKLPKSYVEMQPIVQAYCKQS